MQLTKTEGREKRTSTTTKSTPFQSNYTPSYSNDNYGYSDNLRIIKVNLSQKILSFKNTTKHLLKGVVPKINACTPPPPK